MVKVRFELNIDEVIECKQFPNNDNEAFFGEQATGKTFLFVDKLTGDKQACTCVQAASEETKYARTVSFFLPPSTTIIDGKEKADATHDDLMSHIQDCCDKVCTTMQSFHQQECDHYSLAMEVMNGIRGDITEGGTGNGISEQTLLEALRIVSNSGK